MFQNLHRECARVAERARSLRIRGFRYSIEGDRVTLEGDALTPDGADSAVKMFRATSAREVVSHLRHAPPNPDQPGTLGSPSGYVHIENLGPDASRLAETITWDVKPGDTLQTIALAIYRDAERIEPILRANPALRGHHGHLTVGTRLRIPAPR